MTRKPIASGNFYPGSKNILEEELGKHIRPAAARKKAFGLIAPHAGYVFSGGCAGKAFGSIIVPKTVILLGANHRGFGHPFAVDGHDSWQTPLGNAEIDTELREKLVADSKVFAIDSVAASQEHSLEVQIPFIQYLNPGAKILPITTAMADLERLKTGATEIVALVKDDPDVLIVASTDMSHYLSVEYAREKDNKAIKKIRELDPEGLYHTVVEQRISMCGLTSTTIMLLAALARGAKNAEIIDYTNSGTIMGDYSGVVAYLSMIIF
jgi:AmmeMemoRadiSam system protein B